MNINDTSTKKSYLSKWRIGRNGKLILLDGNFDRVFSLKKEPDGDIKFAEECYDYYSVTMPPEEARKALTEAMAWLDDEETTE